MLQYVLQLNDLRDWREHYLRQQKLQQSQSTSDLRDLSQEHKVNEDVHDIADNASSTSSASGSTHTASSRASSRNSITIKNKMRIMRHKSVSALSNVNLPSFHNLLSSEMGGDDEKIAPNSMPCPSPIGMASTKEHDEVIEALSGRLAIVKENYMNLKGVVSGKDKEIDSLQFELTKKKEMIADLIHKLMDKPLPPTPTEMHQMEQVAPSPSSLRAPERTVSLGDLETHRLSGPDAITMVVKPVSSGTGPPRYRVEYKRPPASLPPPKPVVSPSYDKGVVFNSHYSFPTQSNESHLSAISTGNGGGALSSHKTRNAKRTPSRAGIAGDTEDVDSDEGI